MTVLTWHRPNGRMLFRNVMPEVLAELILCMPILAGIDPPYNVLVNGILRARVIRAPSGRITVKQVPQPNTPEASV